MTHRLVLVGGGAGIDLLRSRKVEAVTTVDSFWTPDHRGELRADVDLPTDEVVVIAEWATLDDGDRIDAARALLEALPEAAVAGVVTTVTPAADLAGTHPSASRMVALRLGTAAPQPRLFEVVPTLLTAQPSLAVVHGLLRALGLESVQSPDRPGFILDSLLRPFLNHAAQLLEDQVATAQDIDGAVELGLGHKEGPMATLNRAGLAEQISISDALRQATGDQRYGVPTLLRRMDAMGWGTEPGHRPASPEQADQQGDSDG